MIYYIIPQYTDPRHAPAPAPLPPVDVPKPTHRGVPFSIGAEGTGYVFSCNSGTEDECRQLKLFASPDREMAQMVETIKADTLCFLINFETLRLTGPFTVLQGPEWGLVRSAFGGRFGAQVRVVPSATWPLYDAQLQQRVPGGAKNGAGVMEIMKLLQKGKEANDSYQ